MIRRIAFIVAALVILAATHPVTAQQTKPARIGTLLSGSQVSQGHRLDWFRQGLRYLGYVEGRNYVFVSRWAMGKGERMPKLAAELVEAKLDVILVMGLRTLDAVGKATRTIPIVVGTAANLPKNTTFVASLARPGGNVTGSTFDGSALNGKRLGLLKEAVPGARRVAFLFSFSPTKRGSRDLKRIEAAAKALGLKILPLQARTLGETEDAFVSMVSICGISPLNGIAVL